MIFQSICYLHCLFTLSGNICRELCFIYAKITFLGDSCDIPLLITFNDYFKTVGLVPSGGKVYVLFICI